METGQKKQCKKGQNMCSRDGFLLEWYSPLQIKEAGMEKKSILAIIIFIILTAVVIIITMTLWLGRKAKVTVDKNVDGLDDEMKEILYLGSLAPNSHNIQSWCVTVYPEDEKIMIRPDSARRLSVVDPENREQFISLGCYAQTLMHALSAYGYDAEYSYDTGEHLCVIGYKKNGSAPDTVKADLIRKRHTDKRAYISGKSIDDDVLGNMIDEDEAISYYAAGSADFDSIRLATLTAYEKQAYDTDAASELSDWLRLSDSETIEKKDGLPAELLGIGGLKKVLYYTFTDHESAKGDTFAGQGIATCKKQVDNCSGFIVISGESDETSLIDCGRKTVDLWLSLADNDIAVQPLSYALEDEDYKAIVADTCGDVQPQMLFRVGYVGSYGENAGIRRDLSDYITVVTDH
jgi:hypothetical protein